MYFKKPRKKRGIKLTGDRSYDFCPVCFAPFCDPMFQSVQVRSKILTRLKNGCCPACGKKKEFCSCRSGLKLKNPVLKTHSNRKEKRSSL